MTRNPQPAGDNKKWVSKLTAIARAIQDTTKEDPIARRELKQSKIGNGIQGLTMLVAIAAGWFAYLAYTETQRQANTAQDQLVQSTRAWIGPVQFTSDQIVAGQRIGTTIHLKNGGESPALEVISHATVKGADSGKLTEFIYKDVEGSFGPSRMVMQPDQVVLIRAFSDNPVTADQIAKIQDPNSRSRVYIHGLLTYKDIYKSAHTTKYCVTIQPDLKNVRWCEEYNDAD